jgi:type IV secretory pathway TrbD component
MLRCSGRCLHGGHKETERPLDPTTTLDGVNQREYLEGNSNKSAREVFFYYSGATPSAVRFRNWKMYYSMTASSAAGWTDPLVHFHWTIVANIKRDPFEQNVLLGDAKTLANVQGALAGPMTAYVCDWNILPLGQQLWLEELESYQKFPPLQAPESYNLGQVLEEVRKANSSHPSD